MTKTRTLCTFGATASLIIGCASYPPPSDHLASAIAATRGAQEAGATQTPRAALQLKLAEEQIAQARQMMENGDNERADFMTLRAYNDAELGLAIARAESARRRAEQAETQLAKTSNPDPTPAAPSVAPAPPAAVTPQPDAASQPRTSPQGGMSPQTGTSQTGTSPQSRTSPSPASPTSPPARTAP